MSGTSQSISYLLSTEFKDGQPVGSITPARMRDVIATFASRTCVSIAQYGTLGTADDTSVIQAAEDNVSSTGGGLLYFPPGTYNVSGLVKKSGTIWIGAGSQTTILKLKSSATSDVVVGQNFSSLTGTTSSSGIVNWGIWDICLDGNRASAPSGGWGLRFYGYNYYIHNVLVKSAAGGGIWTEWDGVPASISTPFLTGGACIEITDCGGIGLNIFGPSDTMWERVIAHANLGNAEILIGGANSGGCQIQHSHCYANQGNTSSSFTFKVYGTKNQLTNCIGEGAQGGQFLIACTDSQFVGCQAYYGSTSTSYGYMIGEGTTGASGNVLRSCWFFQDNSSQLGQAVYLQADGGNNQIDIISNVTTGVLFSGAQGPGTELNIKPSGTLPNDGTSSTGGTFQIQRLSNAAFTVSDNNYTDVVNVTTVSKEIGLINGSKLRGYSDAYATTTVLIDPATSYSQMTYCARKTTQALSANSQTITTANFGMVLLTTSGAYTGIILQAGTVDGQQIVLINNSGNTITWNATDTTSHVKAASSNTLAANSAMRFTYDTGTSLWWKS